jgi:hypothetical protein
VAQHVSATPNATELLDRLQSTAGRYVYQFRDIAKLPATKAILDLDPAGGRAVVLEAVARVAAMRKQLGPPSRAATSYANLHHENGFPAAAVVIMGRLLTRKLPFTDADLAALLDGTADLGMVSIWCLPYVPKLVDLAEKHIRAHELSEAVRAAMIRLESALRCMDTVAERRLRAKAGALLRTGPPPGAGAPGGQSPWLALCDHARRATGSRPSATWVKTAHQLVADIGPENVRRGVLTWFPEIDRPAREFAFWPFALETDSNLLVDPLNGHLLRGLVWCSSLVGGDDVARALTALARWAYSKVPLQGPRRPAVGHACIYALGAMPGSDPIGQLMLLKAKIKFGTAQKEIEKALTAAAQREGLPREEIEELAVPAYGLEEVGVRREPLGDNTAELVVTGPADVALRWRTADGKALKSVPAAVKRDHAEDLKELQAAAKDIQKMLPAQRERLDSLYLQQKSWPYPVWRERYLDHPLVGVLARRLIWRFTTGGTTADGIWHDGQLVAADDKPLAEFGPQTTVELWHPIGQPVEAVLTWRAWLERHEVRQPFKQAHREVYVLTDAERNTRVYSNRFAAHILRQHQFNALCGLRGWRNKLRLMVDDEYPPTTRLLSPWNLRAEFWVEGVGDQYGTDTTDSASYLYQATDQVRFYPIGAAQHSAHAGGGGYYTRGPEGSDTPLPLDQVPPLVFSEVMRDVDLFVGVASVGNDPTWSDGGPQGRYRDYWHSYSFGDLSATAQTRKALLERLIPRLKIADRCSFTDRFLIVRGDLRTYKVHLGSGNILMEPNDQYLCIVPKQSAAAGGEKVFLPFEGDQVLSVILSKAFLLAADTAIKDPTITSQIKRA